MLFFCDYCKKPTSYYEGWLACYFCESDEVECQICNKINKVGTRERLEVINYIWRN